MCSESLTVTAAQRGESGKREAHPGERKVVHAVAPSVGSGFKLLGFKCQPFCFLTGVLDVSLYPCMTQFHLKIHRILPTSQGLSQGQNEVILFCYTFGMNLK